MYVFSALTMWHTWRKRWAKLCLAYNYPLCVHITFHSHIVNLVAGDFKKSFKESTKFVKCFCNLFFVPSGRKNWFFNFLKSSLGSGEKVTMVPNLTTKSWSAWFDSFLYHAERYLMFKDFVAEEINRSWGTASNSPIRLEEMYSDEAFLKKLHCQLSFLKVKAPTFDVSKLWWPSVIIA